MNEFQGAKFRPTGNIIKTTNRYGETIYREQFVPTSTYLKYLEEKRRQQALFDLEVLRQKLEWQATTLGYVDDLDLAEYQRKVVAYY